MGTLETLNSAQPADTEAVALGAQRMREERDAIINSFAANHHLDGSHKFPTGDTASRSAATTGKDGRLYLNIRREVIEQQIAGIWSILHAIQMTNIFDASALVLTTVYQDVASTTINTSFGTKLLMIGQCEFNLPVQAVTNDQALAAMGRFAVNGSPITPERSATLFLFPSNQIPILPFTMVGVYDAGFGLTEGNHGIQFQVKAPTFFPVTTMTNRQLTILAL